jgi:P27 family predicted phage terminase small subunit
LADSLGIFIMRGRKPTPTALKVVRGNPGGRPLNEDEPKPKGEAVMPDYLSPSAAAHWPTVAEQLSNAGVLTSMDVAALALYCESFARWQEAQAMIAKTGLVVPGQKGTLTQSPYVVIGNAAFEQMRRLLIEFGMTPSSRSRVTKSGGTDDDEYGAFVKKPRKANG